MPRFTCTHHTTALQKFVLPSGRVLAFDYHGVLKTDEEGARIIRADPLYGRLILEVDESAPAHDEVSTTELSAAVLLPQQAEGRRPPRPSGELDAWLLALLGGNSVPVAEIQLEAAARGVSWPRVKRAGHRIGIVSEKIAFNSGWAWRVAG